MNYVRSTQRLRVSLVMIGVLKIVGALFAYPTGLALYSRTAISHTQAYESLKDKQVIAETSDGTILPVPSRLLNGLEQRMWNSTMIVSGAFAVQGIILFGFAWCLAKRDE